MNLSTHILASWLVANIPGNLSPRDQSLVTIAGLAPDVDGLGAIVEIATRNTAHPLLWWTEYHHALHALTFALVVCVLAGLMANRKTLTFLLAFGAFHLHLFCDLIGSGAPNGEHWPIPYLAPFSQACQLTWAGQWQYNAWPNVLITVVLLLITFRLAWSRGYSPVSLISMRADAVFIAALRKRFPFRN